MDHVEENPGARDKSPFSSPREMAHMGERKAGAAHKLGDADMAGKQATLGGDEDEPGDEHAYTWIAMSREVVALVLLSTCCYLNSLWGEFVFDDIIAVMENKDVRPETPIAKVFEHDFWGTAITDWQSHKSYRPLTILSFRLSYYLAGYHWNEFQFHLVNVVLHAVVTLLALPTARLCFMSGAQAHGSRRQTAAFWAAAFFATHPIHTDAVSSIVSRGEMLSGALLLLSFLAYSRAAAASSPVPHARRTSSATPFPSPSAPTAAATSPLWCLVAFAFWIPLAVALAFVGLLCKEQAITVVALQFAYDVALATPGTRRMTSSYWLIAVTAGYVSATLGG